MRRIITLLVALGLPAVAPAASWTFVANCGENDQVRAYSYDRDSVRHRSGNALVRIRGDYTRSAGSRAQEARILWSFDCAGRTLVERSRAEFGTGGKLVANYKKPTGRMGIPRDSIPEKVFLIVCA